MVEIHWPILLVQAVTFLAGVGILWKLFWKPLKEFMDRRAGGIASNLEQAAAGRAEAERLKAEYTAKLAEIEAKAQGLIQAGAQEGDRLKDQVLSQARDEARRLLDRASAQIEEGTVRALADLRKETARLAVELAEKVARETLTPAVEQRMVDDLMNELTRPGARQ